MIYLILLTKICRKTVKYNTNLENAQTRCWAILDDT